MSSRLNICWVFLLFTFFVPSLFSVEISKEVLALEEEAFSNTELEAALKEFNPQKYQLCFVPRLGSFYVDDLPDGIKWHLRRGIYWEEGIAQFVKKFTKPDTLALDLGAHIGIHTIAMARCVGPKGKVIAFEPQHKMFCELHHNLKQNRLRERVILLQNAVGDSPKWVEMSARDPINEGGTPIGTGGDKSFMVRLDDLNLNQVSFIKMDVESSELLVLRGAVQTLIRNRPVIVFEILGGVDLDNCSQEQSAIYKEILHLLAKLDYRVERIFGNDFIAIPSS